MLDWRIVSGSLMDLNLNETFMKPYTTVPVNFYPGCRDECGCKSGA